MTSTDQTGAPCRMTILFLAMLLIAVSSLGSGVSLAGPGAAPAACLALLLFGLPHGTLDLELIVDAGQSGGRSMIGLVALYLAVAGAMLLVWQVAPVVALTAFIVIAVVHFAEDWDGTGSSFLAQGLALAILSAPAIAHGAALRTIFVDLAGSQAAAGIADGLTLVAPVAIAIGLVAVVALWQSGRRDQAIGGLGAMLAMAVLPPLIGFALFFCLYHSPRNLSAALARVAQHRSATVIGVVLPLTLAALAIAALVFLGEHRVGLSAQAVTASFMTLSILTVPHMAVPSILPALVRLRRRSATARGLHKLGA